MFNAKRAIQRFRPFKQLYNKQTTFKSSKPNPQLIYHLINYFFLQKQQFSCFYMPGSLLSIRLLPIVKTGALLCNIILTGKVLACCANTYAKKISNGVRLPSGRLIKNTATVLAFKFVKKNTTLLRHKASVFFWKKKRIIVRGVAKNANDHNHGGKGRGGVLRGF